MMIPINMHLSSLPFNRQTLDDKALVMSELTPYLSSSLPAQIVENILAKRSRTTRAEFKHFEPSEADAIIRSLEIYIDLKEENSCGLMHRRLRSLKHRAMFGDDMDELMAPLFFGDDYVHIDKHQEIVRDLYQIIERLKEDIHEQG